MKSSSIRVENGRRKDMIFFIEINLNVRNVKNEEASAKLLVFIIRSI